MLIALQRWQASTQQTQSCNSRCCNSWRYRLPESSSVQKQQFYLFIYFFLFASGNFKSLQGSSCVFFFERERDYLFQDTSLPHLVLFFPTSSIPALLVGKGVITQTPSNSSSNNNNNNSNNTSNNNTSNKRNPRTQSQE